MPKVICDVDNILWDMTTELWRGMRLISPTVVPVSQWSWGAWEDCGITKNEFFDIVHAIHADQSLYTAFDGADKFTNELKLLGYEVIVASHRKPEYKEELIDFLDENNIYFDDVYVGFDKTELFNDVEFVIDDCPSTIKTALDMGIIVMTFPYNWNKMYPQTHRKSYYEMLKTIRTYNTLMKEEA